METHIEGISDTIKQIFNFDVVRRLFFLAGIALSVAVGVGLFYWIKEPVYRQLPYHINERNMQPIIQELDKNQIGYKLNDYTNSISVPITLLARAKMILSGLGIKNDDEFSFSYLNEESKIGSSQFLENARYKKALEADLAKTIVDINGINGAKVHLALPQHNIFADENTKPSASIVISVTPGFDNNKEKIRAIIQLIAASVPDLDPTKVVITNQYGHDLSSALNSNSFFSRESLDYQNNLQRSYEKKIKAMIVPILGSNKASVSVNINLDFTQHEQAKEDYDPDKRILRSEQSITENNNSSANGQTPGALANTPPNNQGNAGPPNQATGQSRSEQIKNYEITKSMSYVKNASPKIEGISVAVVLDNERTVNPESNKTEVKPISAETLKKLESLVKSTIGFNKKRGDQVTVVNSTFKREEFEPIPPKPIWQEAWFWEWCKRGGGILAGFIFLIMMYRKLISSFFPKTIHPLTTARTETGEGEGEGDSTISPEMLALKDEQIKIIRELVAKEPNKVAGVIKKWISR